MKIKAAVVKEVGAPFEIKDDVELHDVGPTDLQIHMVASGSTRLKSSMTLRKSIRPMPIPFPARRLSRF